MIRHFLPLLPSQALQGRQVLLGLVLVGHSHGGVIAHTMAQSLESAGFLVRGIVAADTVGLPRKAEMPIPLDPPAIARHPSPYHWHLSSPKVNMMAPEVPPLRGIMPSRAELLVGGAVFPPKHLEDIDHFRILQQSPWDVAAVVSTTFRRCMNDHEAGAAARQRTAVFLNPCSPLFWGLPIVRTAKGQEEPDARGALHNRSLCRWRCWKRESH
eukprot:s7311_g1.t6